MLGIKLEEIYRIIGPVARRLSAPDSLRLRLGNGDSSEFLFLVLQLVQGVVDPSVCEQFLMRSHFAHFTFVHHNDL
jgi:hypothetical protein